MQETFCCMTQLRAKSAHFPARKISCRTCHTCLAAVDGAVHLIHRCFTRYTCAIKSATALALPFNASYCVKWCDDNGSIARNPQSLPAIALARTSLRVGLLQPLRPLDDEECPSCCVQLLRRKEPSRAIAFHSLSWPRKGVFTRSLSF